jgi:acetyl esterase/lipase
MNYVRCVESLMVLLAVASVAAAQPRRPKPPDGTEVHANLEYVPGGNARQQLDLYVPAKTDTLLPVIVWVHGGAWMGGSKDDGGPALPFVGKGYAVASINYRLSQHAVFPAQIEDCKAAIRWLRANAKTYNLNPEYTASGVRRLAATWSRSWVPRGASRIARARAATWINRVGFRQ